MELLTRKLKISKTAAIMCMVIGVLFILFAIAGVLVSALAYPFERPAPYVSGLLLGCLLSAAKVILLERALERSADMDGEASAKNYASLMAILRYVLTVAVLLLVFLFRDVFGLAGVIIGILSLQASAYITGFIMRKKDTAV